MGFNWYINYIWRWKIANCHVSQNVVWQRHQCGWSVQFNSWWFGNSMFVLPPFIFSLLPRDSCLPFKIQSHPLICIYFNFNPYCFDCYMCWFLCFLKFLFSILSLNILFYLIFVFNTILIILIAVCFIIFLICFFFPSTFYFI
jgi:hypothetical protein